jgi:patatin-like phospholipase/acyl hydrolase
MSKRVLVLDGGGAKGLIQLSVLKEIEEKIGKESAQEFDLIVGSSVGAVEGGILSTGLLSASTFRDVMYKSMFNIFKKRLRIPIFQPIYSRKPIQDLLDTYVIGMKMRQCITKFMGTSVNLVDGRTHFFKSWEEKDGELELSQVVLRSGAAPLYFGTLIDEETKSVWMDGGCGVMNAPIMQAFIETMRQGWLLEEHVHILSIGCGQAAQGHPFNKAKNFKNIKQVAAFMDPIQGGLSRTEIAKIQEEWMKSICKYKLDLSFQRLEMYDMPKKMDTIDGVKYRDYYMSIGETLAKDVDYTYL